MYNTLLQSWAFFEIHLSLCSCFISCCIHVEPQLVCILRRGFFLLILTTNRYIKDPSSYDTVLSQSTTITQLTVVCNMWWKKSWPMGCCFGKLIIANLFVRHSLLCHKSCRFKSTGLNPRTVFKNVLYLIITLSWFLIFQFWWLEKRID